MRNFRKYKPSGYSNSFAAENGYTQSDEKGTFKYIWPDDKPIPLDVTDEEYDEICKVCPPIEKKDETMQKNLSELLNKTESIRKMVKFFVILTVISLVCGLILAIIAMSGGGY